MTNLTLAEKVEALLAAKMTYRAIAERAGCDTSTVFRIKNGAVVNPSYAVGSAIDSCIRNSISWQRQSGRPLNPHPHDGAGETRFPSFTEICQQ